MTKLTPILAGFYPDPSICWDGEAYYLATSSFEYLPGVPLHRSTDLVTWELVGHVLDRPSQLPPSDGAPSSGIYAPTLRYHGGRYWLATTNTTLMASERKGQLIVSAEHPQGPWTDPVYVAGTVGIDPDLAWDEDGVCHLTWSSYQPGLTGIASMQVDPLTGETLGEPRLLWGGTGLRAPEAPHLYRIDGWWYLMLAEGGTERGHCVTIARARTLDGPFEECPSNPVLSHRSTSHPVQNTGHGDLVQLADGRWAMVFLGVRPQGQTPGFHVNGRETFIVGIDWQDRWPVVDDRFDVPAVDHSFTDAFADELMEPRWVAPGIYPGDLTRWVGPGRRVLEADGDEPSHPLATRARDTSWTAAARLDVSSGEGRLEVRIDDAHHYGVTVRDGHAQATVRIGPSESALGETITVGGAVTVVVRARSTTAGHPMLGRPEPDVIELAVATEDGAETVLGSADGRYLSTEVAGGFTGRVIGVRALRGQVALEEFRYTTDDDARIEMPPGM